VAYQKVEIDWLDAGKEQDMQELPFILTPIRCHSTGYLTEETEQYVIIAAEITDDNRAACFLTLPRGMIENIRYLEEK
jgi:hypothetical protein